MQAARDAQSSLIEVDQRPGAELRADGVDEPTRDTQRGGRAGSDRRDGPFRHRHSQQIRHGLRGAGFGQELTLVEVDQRGGDPRPVGRRRVHPCRGHAGGARTAPAGPGDQLVLGHRNRGRGQIKNLPAFDHDLYGLRVSAAGAAHRLVPHDHVRCRHLAQPLSGVALLTAGLATLAP